MIYIVINFKVTIITAIKLAKKNDDKNVILRFVSKKVDLFHVEVKTPLSNEIFSVVYYVVLNEILCYYITYVRLILLEIYEAFLNLAFITNVRTYPRNNKKWMLVKVV